MQLKAFGDPAVRGNTAVKPTSMPCGVSWLLRAVFFRIASTEMSEEEVAQDQFRRCSRAARRAKDFY